jgi:hypothetical protein
MDSVSTLLLKKENKDLLEKIYDLYQDHHSILEGGSDEYAQSFVDFMTAYETLSHKRKINEENTDLDVEVFKAQRTSNNSKVILNPDFKGIDLSTPSKYPQWNDIPGFNVFVNVCKNNLEQGSVTVDLKPLFDQWHIGDGDNDNTFTAYRKLYFQTLVLNGLHKP